MCGVVELKNEYVGKATRGSQLWIQEVINKKPMILDSHIKGSCGISIDETIKWLSPRKEEGYKEYRDQSFLDLLGIDLAKRKLTDFWPTPGASWDALGKTSKGNILLVEAKSHIKEVDSPPTGAKDPKSRELIQ